MLVRLGGGRGRRGGLGLRHRVRLFSWLFSELLSWFLSEPLSWFFLGPCLGDLSEPRIDRRWPSNTVVSQWRSFSARPAQSFAAAAALIRGPAPRRSCIPRPLLPSLIMMIGRSAATSGWDLLRPRQSARRPSTEFAPPRSIAKRVCWTAIAGRLGFGCLGRLGWCRGDFGGSGRRLGFLLGGVRLNQFRGRRIRRRHDRLRRHQRKDRQCRRRQRRLRNERSGGRGLRRQAWLILRSLFRTVL